jgi:hypothetical protein
LFWVTKTTTPNFSLLKDSQMTSVTSQVSKKTEQVAELHLFKSRLFNVQYVFRDGQSAVFKNGQYATKKKAYIDELTAEINDGHPHFYFDENKLTITEEELAPDYEARKKMREEVMAEFGLKGRDMGSYDSKQSGAGTGIASTANVGQAAVGNNEGAVKALNAGEGVRKINLSATTTTPVKA